MKICAKCYISKTEDLYYKNNKTNVLENMCKECRKSYRKDYCSKNKESVKKTNKKWRNKNIEEVKLLKKQYYQNNKVKILSKIKERLKDFRKVNGISYNSFLYRTNINSKLKIALRCRLNLAIKNNQKSGSAIKNLGCSVEELKNYIESKWKPGMSWYNHSLDGWHIDHIRPLDDFNLTDPDQLKEACNYTNLQPLWAKENLSKGGNYRLTEK